MLFRSDLLKSIDKNYQDAHAIMLSPKTQKSFRIDEETDALRERYGKTKIGQRLLLARRLVEAGVRFVTINEPVGWDTHQDNFGRLRTNLPVVDQAVSALLDDLSEKGMLKETMVMMFGEFGRTPSINKQAGRDHWAQAMTIILAGGGSQIRGLDRVIEAAIMKNGDAKVTRVADATFAGAVGALNLAKSLPQDGWKQLKARAVGTMTVHRPAMIAVA